MKAGDRIVIINEKCKHYDREFEIIVCYDDGSVCVQSEYFTFQKDEYIPSKVYNSKLYKALN